MTHPVPNRKSPSKAKPVAGRAITFTGKIRRYLRALGHGLAPVVQIGKSGLSAGVKEELERALSFHELIKVRLLAECPIPREDAGSQIAAHTHSELIQTLGGVLLLYRGRTDKPGILSPGLDDEKIKAAKKLEKKTSAKPKPAQPRKPERGSVRKTTSARPKMNQPGGTAARRSTSGNSPSRQRDTRGTHLKRR